MTSYKRTLLCLFWSIFLIQRGDSWPEVDPVINTTLGLIRGVRADDGDYFMFMGIPYARVNRTNPFGRAIPQEPFDGIFNAIDDTAICPQVESINNTIVGTLDCLHLNIYVPSTASVTSPQPVMVMIYGGGFTTGDAGRYLYGPKYLVRHDVILVTLNYRLGPYGFMCLGIPDIPGNEGLKDQTLALRWIKNNIEAFGGDRDKITAFGNSAGGRSVDFHLASPQEKLFDQIILQSGTALGAGLVQPIENAPFQITSHLGFITDDVNEAMTFLAKLDEKVMIDVTSKLNLFFGPCIEKEFEGVEGFLTQNWIPAPIPKVNKMPILLGNTDQEMITLIQVPSVFFDNSRIQSTLSSGFDTTDPDFDGMDELVHRFYMGDEDITEEKKFEVIDFISDFAFNHAKYRSIAKYLNNDAGDIYLYKFSYVGNRNFVRLRNNITVGGAAHTDELGYLFDYSFYDTPNVADQLFIDRLTTLWTNFAKFGNPTPESSDLIPVIWRPIRNNSAYHYLDLNSELVLGTRPFHERMSFWDLFYKANFDLQIVSKSE